MKSIDSLELRVVRESWSSRYALKRGAEYAWLIRQLRKVNGAMKVPAVFGIS